MPARVLQASGLLGAVVVLLGGCADAALFGPMPDAGAALLLWGSRWLWVPASAVASLGLLPDGRLPSPRWRVVLMDLSMPGGGGLAATERLAREAPHIAVLVLTMSAEDASVTAALRAGARGYLVKGAPRAEVERALQTVADGGVVVGASVAHRVASLLTAADTPDRGELASLSDREREVLDLMAQGLDNAEIARRLVLSPKTVRNVVSAVFGKLGTSDRVQVVLRAREAGLGMGKGDGAGAERPGTVPP